VNPNEIAFGSQVVEAAYYVLEEVVAVRIYWGSLISDYRFSFNRMWTVPPGMYDSIKHV